MPTVRKCLGCIRPSIPGRSRCETCERIHERQRKANLNDKYGYQHRKARASLKQTIEHQLSLGIIPMCARCHGGIIECDNQGNLLWHADHLDDGTYGWSHPDCNQREGGKNSYAKQKNEGRPPTWAWGK